MIDRSADVSAIIAKRLDMSGGRTIMDRISESLLTEFSTEHNIKELPEEERFEHFGSFLAISKHLGESFDTSDVVTHVVTDGKSNSGGADTGIDGIAVIVNGSLMTDVEEFREAAKSWPYLDATIVFVQAERSPNFDGAKIGTFGFGVADFFNVKPKLARNEKISNAAELTNALYDLSSKFKGNPICRMYYMTTGKWVGDATLEARRKAVIDDIQSTGQFRDVDLIPVDAEMLQKMYRQTKNANAKDFVFANKTVIPEIPGVSQAYLGYLPAQELMKLLKDDDGEILSSIFYENVRDWQGENDVNQEIVGTLTSANSPRFVLMNNGITIIARNLQPTGNKFHIEDYQIVNGCQTSHVLFNNQTLLTEQVTVPVRLIATHDEGVVNSIIRATNRQTQVTEEQFFALQEFPKQLEAYFESFPIAKRLYFERRDMQYSRLQIEKTRIITRSNTIKSFAAMFLDEPHRTTRNYASVTAKVGKEIFVKEHRKEPYYTAAFALYFLEYMFRNKKLDAKYKPARFHILLAARLISNNGEMPSMKANKMEGYCDKILKVLWNATDAEALMVKSAKIIEKAAAGNFDRDNIRTDSFTKKVIAAAQGA